MLSLGHENEKKICLLYDHCDRSIHMLVSQTSLIMLFHLCSLQSAVQPANIFNTAQDSMHILTQAACSFTASWPDTLFSWILQRKSNKPWNQKGIWFRASLVKKSGLQMEKKKGRQNPQELTPSPSFYDPWVHLFMFLLGLGRLLLKIPGPCWIPQRH